MYKLQKNTHVCYQNTRYHKHITRLSFCFHSMDIDMDTVDPEQPNQKKNMWILSRNSKDANDEFLM